MSQNPFRVDVHHHFMIPEFARAIMKATKLREVYSTLRATGLANLKDSIDKIDLKWSTPKVLEWMDRNQIAAVIGSLPAPVYLDDKRFFPELARRCNEHFAEVINQRPGRFGGFAMLPLPDAGAALNELAYALDTLKLDGVVLEASIKGVYLGSPEQNELFDELNRRNTVVFIHPFVTPSMDVPLASLHVPPYLVEYVLETTRAVTNLLFSGTLERCPNIRFILSHAGGTVPFLIHRLGLGEYIPELGKKVPQGVASYLRRLYYDTALSASPHGLRSLQECTDNSHILFGSDYPAAPEEVTVASIQGLDKYTGFTDEQRQAIYRDNALALFPRLVGANGT